MKINLKLLFKNNRKFRLFFIIIVLFLIVSIIISRFKLMEIYDSKVLVFKLNKEKAYLLKPIFINIEIGHIYIRRFAKVYPDNVHICGNEGEGSFNYLNWITPVVNDIDYDLTIFEEKIKSIIEIKLHKDIIEIDINSQNFTIIDTLRGVIGNEWGTNISAIDLVKYYPTEKIIHLERVRNGQFYHKFTLDGEIIE